MISAVRAGPWLSWLRGAEGSSQPRSNPAQACLANKSFIPTCKHEVHGQVFSSAGTEVLPGAPGAQHP